MRAFTSVGVLPVIDEVDVDAGMRALEISGFEAERQADEIT